MAMIASNRTFGVEIETGWDNKARHDAFNKSRDSRLQLVHDGSINLRTEDSYTREVVTPVLKGATGEDYIRNVCRGLQKSKAWDNEPSCSVHVHLGAKEFVSDYIVITMNNKDFVNFKTNNKIEDSVTMAEGVLKDINNVIYGEALDKYNWVRNAVGRSEYGSLGILDRDNIYYKLTSDGVFLCKPDIKDKIQALKKFYQEKEEITDEMANEYELRRLGIITNGVDSCLSQGGTTFVRIENSKSFSNLKKIFAFYVAYSDVLSMMVPDSRKINNAYCQSIGDSFSLEEVMNTSSYAELKRLWYRADSDSEVRQRSRNKRDDSRYHDYNLHSLWYRYGTIEVRSHPHTLDENKILLWVDLHQAILDNIINVSIEQIVQGYEKQGAKKIRHMIDMLSLNKRQEAYVIRLITYYNSFKENI